MATVHKRFHDIIVLNEEGSYSVRMSYTRSRIGQLGFAFLHKHDQEIPADAEDTFLSEDEAVTLAMRCQVILSQQEAGKLSTQIRKK